MQLGLSTTESVKASLSVCQFRESTYRKLNIANTVIKWPTTSCNLKVKAATRDPDIFEASRLDNRTVPCKLQQWDRYSVPQNVFLLQLRMN